MVGTALSRAELEAHEHAIRQPFDVVVKELRELLTPRLVAFIASVGETRAVRQWAGGSREVKSGEAQDRLRLVLQVALLLGQHDSPLVVQAWFQGLNPHLDDRSPTRLLGDGGLDEVGPLVLGAARAFLVGG